MSAAFVVLEVLVRGLVSYAEASLRSSSTRSSSKPPVETRRRGDGVYEVAP